MSAERIILTSRVESRAIWKSVKITRTRHMSFVALLSTLHWIKCSNAKSLGYRAGKNGVDNVWLECDCCSDVVILFDWFELPTIFSLFPMWQNNITKFKSEGEIVVILIWITFGSIIQFEDFVIVGSIKIFHRKRSRSCSVVVELTANRFARCCFVRWLRQM